MLLWWAALPALLALPAAWASLYSGAEEVCGLPECICQGDTVSCTCQPDSSFQESFMLIDPTRRLRHLTVSACPRLVLPASAVTLEAQLVSITVRDVRHLEVHRAAVTVSSLRSLTLQSCGLVTFQPGALRPGLQDAPLLNLTIEQAEQVVVKGRAFANLRTFTASNIGELQLEQHAFQLKVNTDQPTIDIRLVNISTPSLSSSAFPSSFRSISIEQSRIVSIATNAFSGLTISSISFIDSTIQRIERGAFSNSAAISSLVFQRCNISSLSQKSVVAGVSDFQLVHSEIQSIAKHGAIDAMVASVRIEHNRFKTLATEAFQFVAWDTVVINNNTFDFAEEGAINAIKAPSEDQTTSFTFTHNHIADTNRRSLVTQMPQSVTLIVSNNSFGKRCDCKMETYIKTVTGFTDLSNPFVDLTAALTKSSLCRVGPRARGCFPLPSVPLPSYSERLCMPGPSPACVSAEGREDDVVRLLDPDTNFINAFDEFVLLFQVKTTKGILLFLLFCVLSSVATVTICVSAVWVHRLCRRAKLSRAHCSGSFQFNSGEEKQVLYGSDQTTCSTAEEEPTYAEIAEVHPCPRSVGEGTLAAWVTLPHSSPFHSSTMETTLPSLGAPTLPGPNRGCPDPEAASLLSGSLETTQLSRLSMSETSLTDEIMLALRDKLSDPSNYMSVLDAKAGEMPASPVKEEELYCSPLYNDPLQP